LGSISSTLARLGRNLNPKGTVVLAFSAVINMLKISINKGIKTDSSSYVLAGWTVCVAYFGARKLIKLKFVLHARKKW